MHIHIGALLLAAALPAQAVGALQVGVRLQNGSPRVTVTGATDTVFGLERSTDLKVWEQIVTETLSAAPFVFTDSPITNASARFYRVQPLPPMAPTGLNALFDINQQAVMLSWTVPAGAKTTLIEWSSSSETNWMYVDEVNAPTNHYREDYFAHAGLTNFYCISACNDIGCSAPCVPVFVAVPFMAAPSWQKATYDDSDPANPFVSLCWVIPAGADYVIVERSTNGPGNFEEIAFLPDNCFADLDIEAGSSYTYRLIATGRISDSAPSALVTVPVPRMPAPIVRSYDSTFDTNSRTISVDFCWSLPAGAEGVTIERRASDQANFEDWDDVFAPDYCYQDIVTEAGKSFIYRFIAFNTFSSSVPSSEVRVPIPVPAPELILADTTTPLTVDLEWTDDLENESQFELQRINPNGSTTSAFKGPDVFSHTSSPPIGSTYKYRVRVMAGGVWSLFSNELSATPQLDQVSLVSPASNAMEIHRPTTFTWVAAPSAYEYRIEVYLDTVRKDTGTVPAPTRAYTSSNLTALTQYKWHVQARTQTGTGNGEWSDWWYFKTR